MISDHQLIFTHSDISATSEPGRDAECGFPESFGSPRQRHASKSVISCPVGMVSHSDVKLPQHELTALPPVCI